MNAAPSVRPVRNRDAMSPVQTNFLSTKSIPVGERLIVALDVPTNEDAIDLVETLGDAVRFYKVGLEIVMGGRWTELVEFLVNKHKDVMLDIKFFDVPETVGAAVKQAVKQRVRFVTVHGDDQMLKAAIQEKNGVQILAVTVLTSMNSIDIAEFGFTVPVEELVLSRAKRALRIGCDGIISSGLEAPELRRSLGDKFLIVTPGIRPVKNVDDQKRTVDVEEAFTNGADYIVVGRPIRNASDPRKAAEDIQKRIATLFP